MNAFHVRSLLALCALTMLPLLGLVDLQAQDRITGQPFTTRSEVMARHGMAATSQPLATQVALDILKQGGTAVDAAIAANAVLGLVEPTGNGIGGDLFAIVWDAETRQLHGLNASGRSPQSLTLEHFKAQGLNEIPNFGPLPVSVPGCVDGWFELHGKFGKLPMEVILAPAIAYAREGFPVTEVIGYYLSSSARRFADWPNFAETYMPEGRGLQKGDVFANPRLANTLELIAQKGRKAFYRGEIAEKIDAHMREIGGFLSLEDLKAYKSEWVTPVSTNYRGYDVWELPPNGQGIAALQILNILEGYDIAGMGFGTADYIHTFVEAKKLAFEDRAHFYADPDFVDIPVQELISKSYAAERRTLIRPDRAGRSYSHGSPEEGDTIYLTVADDDGNMVSLIQSNYLGMGSGVVPGDLGFMLQDRGALFSLEPGHANVYEPGKRPFHTIIPAFVTRDGQPLMSFGLMGGAMQPQGHAQIIVNMIDFGMNLQEAGDAPRINHSGSSQPTGSEMTDGGTLYLESGIAPEVLRELTRRGHRLGTSIGIFGGYQAIWYDAEKDVYYGASESRKDGQAAGY
ncbi:MAG: gamma-glutamyltransferase [Bacteroidetes bacterium]|nr:MAG: gamma-glutamyltransferase [Bacteroidota bacterium]